MRLGLQQALLDAEAIEGAFVGALVVEVGPGGVDGFEEFLGRDLAGLALVLAGVVGHAGDAVVFVAVAVPGQILIAFVAKLKLYGFWRFEGLFAELLRILEKSGADGLAAQRAARTVDIVEADFSGIGAGGYFCGGRGAGVCWLACGPRIG